MPTTLSFRAATLAERWARWRSCYAARGQSRLLFRIYGDPTLPVRPLPWPALRQERIEWAWRCYQRQTERLAWLDDDTIPWLDPYTGTELFAAAFGCPVEYPKDDMPFARPLLTDAAAVARLRPPSLEHPALAEVFAIADALRARAGSQALMRLPDIQSPVDIAALIWDKNEFFPAMHTDPAAVEALVAMTQDLLERFVDAWFARYGRAYAAHYPVYYAEQGLTLSEDEAGAVHPDHFARFFVPSLQHLSQRYGGLGIHCCANSRHQWAHFRALPGLRVLNICQPAAVVREAFDFFGPELVHYHHGWRPAGEPETWPAQLAPGTRLVAEFCEPDAYRAMALAARLRACGACP